MYTVHIYLCSCTCVPTCKFMYMYSNMHVCLLACYEITLSEVLTVELTK